MHQREIDIRRAVIAGQYPSLDDIRWLLITLDSTRLEQRRDPLLVAMSDTYGECFAPQLVHDMLAAIKDSCEEAYES